MDTRKAILRIAFALALAGLVAVPASSSSHDWERAFFSDDADEDVGDLSGDPDLEEPATFARVADLTFATTNPETDDSIPMDVGEFRESELAAIGGDQDRSHVLPQTDGVENEGSIRDAHITFLGFEGGAQPAFGGPSGDLRLIGRSGTVLNHFDFRIDDGPLPDDYCESKDWDTDTRTIEVPSARTNPTIEVYTDGDYSCHDYDWDVETDRSVQIGDQGFDGGSAIDFDGLTSDSRLSVTLVGEVRVSVTETVTDHDWDPDSDVEYPTSKSDGDWDEAGESTDSWTEDHVRVTDEGPDALVTDNGALDVEQTVIETSGESNTVILEFDGPGSGDVDWGQLQDRLLWSYVAFGSDSFVDGTWRTYTTRQVDEVEIRGDGGTTTDDSPPHPLKQHVYGADQRPTVTTDGASEMQVVDFDARRYDAAGSTGSDVKLEAKRPAVYDRIVVTGAPEEATHLVTIHGTSVPLSVDERVEHRTPAITIEETGSGSEVRVHVEDPATGDPITGREVYLYGADRERATTDADGNVYAERENAIVKASVAADELRNVDDGVYYGRAGTSKAFGSQTLVVDRLYSLAESFVLTMPLVVLYFYVRHFEFWK